MEAPILPSPLNGGGWGWDEEKNKEISNDANDASYRFQGKAPGESYPPKNLRLVS
jgi:hypothetical protein